MQAPVAPSESTTTPLSSRSASTISGSISYDEENIIAANLNKKQKKWLPWKLNWFNKGQKKALDRNSDGARAVSPSSSRDGSLSSRTGKSPNQLVPPEEEDERDIQDTAPRLASLRELMTTEQVNV